MRDRAVFQATERDPSGFTLIEALVSTALFAIVAAAIGLMYQTSQTTMTRGNTRTDLQQNARVAMDEMVRQLRMAGYTNRTQRIVENPLGTGKFELVQASSPFGFVLYNQGGVNFSPVARDDELQFTADVLPACPTPPPAVCPPAPPPDPDGDGLLQASEREIIGFRLSAPNTLNRYNGAGGWQPLARNVQSLRFTYFDGENKPIPNPLPQNMKYTLSATDMLNIRKVRIELTVSATVEPQKTVSYTLASEVVLRNLGQ